MKDSFKNSIDLFQRRLRFRVGETVTFRGSRSTEFIEKDGNLVIRHSTICEHDESDEQVMWAEYHFNKSGGTEYLCELLMSDIELTKDTRIFIAGVLDGIIKPHCKKKRNYFRDRIIYSQVSKLVSEGVNLTSNGSKDEGAAAQVAKLFGMDEENEPWEMTEANVIQIYTRMKPKPPNIEDYL